MSTLLNVLGELRIALNASFGWPIARQLEVDLSDELSQLTTADLVYYQLVFQYEQAQTGSNVTYPVVSVEVKAHYRLSDAMDERTYTEGVMLTAQASLLDKDWWRLNIGSMYNNADDAYQLLVNDDVTREGNVISYSVLATFAITP